MPASRFPARRRLQWAALIVLVVGLAIAGAVHLLARSADAGSDGYRVVGGQVFATEDSPAADRESERLGGKALVRTAAFSRWVGSLWHGERLAGTLAVLSVLIALGCLYFAGLVEEDDADTVD